MEALIRHAQSRVIKCCLLRQPSRYFALRSCAVWRWDNVNFTKNRVQVRERADKFSTMGKPKSGAGKRNVPLPHDVATALKEWRLRYAPGEYVFPAQRAAILSSAEMVRALHQAGRAAERVVKWKLESEDDTPPAMIVKHGMVPNSTVLTPFATFMLHGASARRLTGAWACPPRRWENAWVTARSAKLLDIYGHLFPRGDDAGALPRGA